MRKLLFAVLPFTAAAALPPPVPPVAETPCLKQVMGILKTDFNDFKIVDGAKVGAEFVDAGDFAALPTREYFGTHGRYHFGLVGYARILQHGDGVSHRYHYVVAATCTYDYQTKTYILDDQNSDENLDGKDISLQNMDFAR